MTTPSVGKGSIKIRDVHFEAIAGILEAGGFLPDPLTGP